MARLPWKLSTIMLIKLWVLSCWLGVGLSVKTLPFWLDSYLNCTGPTRLLYKNERAIIYGQGAIESRESPQNCKLTLKTENNFERTYFRIQIKQALIKECTVTFTIYDREVSQSPLDSYDCKKGKGNYEFIYTLSDTAVFELKKNHQRDIFYDIEIIVTPLVVSGGPGWENDFGRDQGIYPEQFPIEATLGIVGAALGVTLIIIVVVTVKCYRRQKAKHSNGEEHVVGFTNTGISYEPKGNLSDISAATWSTDMRSTKPKDPLSMRMARPSEDANSVFDNDTTYKGRPIAMDSLQKLADSSRGQRRGFDRRDHNRLRGRDAAMNRSRDASFNRDDSFNSDQEEHSPRLFVERILTSRVKTTPRKWDLEEEEEEDLKDEAVGDDDYNEEQHSDDDDDVEEEDTEEEEVTEKKMEDSEEEQSEEEEDDESDGNEKPPDYRNATQDIPSISQARNPVHPQHQPQHMQPSEHPQEHFMSLQPPQYVPQYMMYPGATAQNQYITAPPGPNQYVAAPPGPNQFVAAPPGYNQSGNAPSGPNQFVGPPPGYNQSGTVPSGSNQFCPVPPESAARPAVGEERRVGDREADLPIYSYLAQRGCVPLGGGRESPVSVSSQGASRHVMATDEPDQSSMPQLDSGVELMRR
ncbi:uncharacterized protein LOC121369213 [Gigantopelta aegis]|uniref:uncharacterized protein LOC121369213 n=1 Tax=Gigantopelta aegis TaxID=1735272 RepID=UPI001B88C2A8|nr:uncharacterized protein LOC121369213 [Gigantopelta aegis]XP_041350079.1 uncharacterized protein LOC121369213 [Gigantopelta aegis]